MIRHFGVLIPSTNTTVEVELTRIIPETLQFHVARLGTDGDTPFSPSLDEDIVYQSKMLGNAQVEVTCLIQTSASLFEERYDSRIKKVISEASGAPAVTSAESIGHAVNSLGLRTVAIVSPYSDAVMRLAKNYFEKNARLNVVAMEGFGATNAYAIGGLDERHALQAFKRIDSPNIEVLIVPGGNFPTMSRIASWEAELGKPVTTTNQVVLWACMTKMGLTTKPISGYGRLLAKLPT